VRKPSQQTREQIVASARRLFNRHGFDAVSIDAIMAGAGLTRGAFYTYFASKSDLYADVLTCFFNTPNAPNNWGGVHLDLDAPDARDQIIRAYLSRQHADAVETACPMVALPSDVARGGSSAKQAFERAFTAMINCLEGRGRKGQRADRAGALAVAALCIGGMVTARAIDDRALADELRDACAATALGLERRTHTKIRKSRVKRGRRR
jgi:TetR/AcrR family transcriptional regulator, transcriptional repressor for nem operon